MVSAIAFALVFGYCSGLLLDGGNAMSFLCLLYKAGGALVPLSDGFDLVAVVTIDGVVSFSMNSCYCAYLHSQSLLFSVTKITYVICSQ